MEGSNMINIKFDLWNNYVLVYIGRMETHSGHFIRVAIYNSKVGQYWLKHKQNSDTATLAFN